MTQKDRSAIDFDKSWNSIYLRFYLSETVTSERTRIDAHVKFEGFQPEWCISTLHHAWDTSFCRAWNSSWKWWFSQKWASKIVEQNIFSGEKNRQAYFFSMKIQMMDLWMQIEGKKLVFIMNFSMLDFFKFASRMPRIAQRLVSTFKNFPGEHAPGPI